MNNQLIELVNDMIIWVSVLTLIVQIVTEVIKNAFTIKSANVLKIMALVVSIVVSFVAMSIYYINLGYTLGFQQCCVFVLCGFCVAYASQVGYDKFVSIIFGFIKKQ